MGVNQKRKERFQGRVENQAGARAHKYVKESVSTMLCRTQLLMEKVNVGPALGKGKEGVAERDQNASANAVHGQAGKARTP